MILRLHLSLVLPSSVTARRAAPYKRQAKAIQRDHRCGVSCPRRALDDEVKIGAVKHSRDCTKVASEPI
jgi:hypothetical protein